MTTNHRTQSRFMRYLVEHNGDQYGVYMNYETAVSIAKSLKGYAVVRCGDEKIWES